MLALLRGRLGGRVVEHDRRRRLRSAWRRLRGLEEHGIPDPWAGRGRRGRRPLALGAPEAARPARAPAAARGTGGHPRAARRRALGRAIRPAAAAQSLQVYVHGLRRALGAERIETHGSGYRIRVEPGELDLERFERARRARAGRRSRATARPTRPRISARARALARAAARRPRRRAGRRADGAAARRVAHAPRSSSANDARARARQARRRSSPSSRRSSRSIRTASASASSRCSRSIAPAGRRTRSTRTATRGGRSSTSSASSLGRRCRSSSGRPAPRPVARRAGAARRGADRSFRRRRRRSSAGGSRSRRSTALLRRDECAARDADRARAAPARRGSRSRSPRSSRRELRDGAVFVDLAPVRDPALLGPTIARDARRPRGRRRPARRRRGACATARCCSCSTTSSSSSPATPFDRRAARAPRRGCACSRRAARRSAFARSTSTRCRRSQRPSPTDASFEELAANDAVRLFAARARAVDPAFAAHRGERRERRPRSAAGSTACRWRSSSPRRGPSCSRPSRWPRGSASSLDLLTGGARDLPPRQQTLRATLDWSHELLTTAERRCSRVSPSSRAAARSRRRGGLRGRRLDVLAARPGRREPGPAARPATSSRSPCSRRSVSTPRSFSSRPARRRSSAPSCRTSSNSPRQPARSRRDSRVVVRASRARAR